MPNNLIGAGYRLTTRTEFRDPPNNPTEFSYIQILLPDNAISNDYAVSLQRIQDWNSGSYEFAHWVQLKVTNGVLEVERTPQGHIPIYLMPNTTVPVATMGLEPFIFHCRHNLHIPLSLIAQMLTRPNERVTASALGARYLRICNHYLVTPYVSMAQQRNRARQSGTSAGRSRGGQDNEFMENPDYITPDVEEWFNDLGISFGHEIEVSALSVRRAHQAMMSLPDIATESETNYRHNFGNEWKVVPDGTCSAEIVSPPMRNGVTDFLQVRRVMFALKRAGARITASCGGHVHFGVEHLTKADRARIIEAHYHFQHLFDSFVAQRRRGRHVYINPRSLMEMEMLSEAFANNPAHPVQDANRVTVYRGEVSNYSERYRHWNVCSWGKYGTFENRQLEGCLNPKKMFAWLALNRAFIKACVTGEDFIREAQPLVRQMEDADGRAQSALHLIAVRTEMPDAVKNLIMSYLDNN